QLRAVRGDHRQGRAADPARGRRRPALHGHLSGSHIPASFSSVTSTRPEVSSVWSWNQANGAGRLQPRPWQYGITIAKYRPSPIGTVTPLIRSRTLTGWPVVGA